MGKTSRQLREEIPTWGKRPDGSGKESPRGENVLTVPGRNPHVGKTSRRLREGIPTWGKRPDGSGEKSPRGENVPTVSFKLL
ncbi:MAG: hypothetical protein LBP64_08845 [Tannerella sp.]|nr:hypothetical protein [Tannerella sp.]